MPQQYPLDLHQQELVNIVKAAHQTLAVARKVRTSELARRITEEKIRWESELERQLARIKMDLDAEVAVHESALDEALIAAYEAGVPVRRIALDGFGNRYDGGVHQLLVKLRTDGRVGSRDSYQRNNSDPSESRTEVAFPEPVNVDAILTEATTIEPPIFTKLPTPLVLVEPDKDGNDAISVPAVRLDMDARDPWFKAISKNARVDTPYRNATFCTLFQHPASGQLITYESQETGAVIWDHPVARWVVEHQEEALAGFRAALSNN